MAYKEYFLWGEYRRMQGRGHHRQPVRQLAVQSSCASSAQGLAPPALCPYALFGGKRVPQWGQTLREGVTWRERSVLLGPKWEWCLEFVQELAQDCAKLGECGAKKTPGENPGSILLFKIGYYSI